MNKNSEAVDNKTKLISDTIRYGDSSSLSDVELLSVVIESKSGDKSAIDIAQRLLTNCSGDLSSLVGKSFNHIARASETSGKVNLRISALLELSRRIKPVPTEKIEFIKSSDDSIQLLRPVFHNLKHEEFWVIYLNNSLRVLEIFKVGQGELNSTIVDIKSIIRKALSLLASKIIISHNHNTPCPQPSQTDIELTSKITKAAELFDITVVDHIIMGSDNSHYSFNDNI